MTEKLERTHCILCGHLNTLHDDEPDGTRPCRSPGHPKGLTCRECRALLAPEHREAIRDERDNDGFEAAWAAYYVTFQAARDHFGASWPAHFTDIHQSALASALIAYRKHIADEGGA